MLNRTGKEELDGLLAEKKRRDEGRRIWSLYPEKGPLRRELYPKHMAFFAAGLKAKIRGFRAAHRIGKTWGSGGYELVLHCTGLYPDWWVGRRFKSPVRTWACGTTNQETRDVLQAKLLGPLENPGTGLIPREQFIDFKRKATSVPDTVEMIFVKHVTGGVSTITLKGYEQGKEAFYGTEQDVILLDEEPPLDIYLQCLIRTMTVNGIVMLTFTPLKGHSEVVLSLSPGGKIEGLDLAAEHKFVVGAGWDDAPHLTEEMKAVLASEIPKRLRGPMMKGLPALGAGAVYQIPAEKILIPDFKIPDHYLRSYALDVGWNCTAALWRAKNPETGIRYYYSEYKKGEELPIIHAQAIKARGQWIKGVDDPAALGRSQKDGEKLHDEYVKLGLKLVPADNAVEAGVFVTEMGLATGEIRVFESLGSWQEEYGLYRRDDKGKIVKENDHLMDCLRYLEKSGNLVEQSLPPEEYVLKLLLETGSVPKEERLLFYGLGVN